MAIPPVVASILSRNRLAALVFSSRFQVFGSSTVVALSDRLLFHLDQRVVRIVATLDLRAVLRRVDEQDPGAPQRSEEHTSELQSLRHLVCRLLLEKKRSYESTHVTYKSCESNAFALAHSASAICHSHC